MKKYGLNKAILPGLWELFGRRLNELQTKLADWLNLRCCELSPQGQLAAFILFCTVGSAYLIGLLIRAVFN